MMSSMVDETRKRWKYVLLLAVVVLLGALAVVFIPSAEPAYRGKPLSHWVENFGTPTTYPSAPSEPERAICEIGAEAVPYLARWIAYEPPTWKIKFFEFMQTRFGSALVDHERNRAEGAVSALITLGTKAEQAIPPLALLVNNPKSPNALRRSETVLLALRSHVPVANLVLMTNNSPINRLGSIRVVDLRGTNSRPGVLALIQRLRDVDAEVASSAAQMLGAARMEANLVVPALAKCLKDERTILRKSAIEALGKFHVQARPAVPDLVALLEDPDPLIRNFAADALDFIDPAIRKRAASR
jgi:hypothetical protein